MSVHFGPDDVIWSFAGFRPLYGDEADAPSKVSRDYVLEIDGGKDAPPVLTVFGGKITTHRALAEHALAMLRPFLREAGAAWTGRATLPGGDFANGDVAALTEALSRAAPALSKSLLSRWALAYGSRAFRLLEGVSDESDLGEQFEAGLSRHEVDYLVRNEYAVTSDDILWRRSKLGLHISAEGAARLSSYLEGKSSFRSAATG